MSNLLHNAMNKVMNFRELNIHAILSVIAVLSITTYALFDVISSLAYAAVTLLSFVGYMYLAVAIVMFTIKLFTGKLKNRESSVKKAEQIIRS